MTSILEELKKGNIQVLTTMTDEEISYIMNLIMNSSNKNQFLHIILPYFENKGYYYGMEHDIFHCIYLDPDFKANTFYLLHKEYLLPQDLLIEEIDNMLHYTSWGIEYVYHNLERILVKDDIHKKINTIIEAIKDSPEIYHKFLEKVLKISNQEIRDKFIETSLLKHMVFSLENMIRALYKDASEFDYEQEYLPFVCKENNLVFSELPHFLLFYCKYDTDIKKMMLDYFEIFFQAEESKKMSVLDKFYSELPLTFLTRYQPLFSLYEQQKTLDMDRILTILINSNQEEAITEFLKDKDIEYLRAGSTTRVFKVGDKVLKFSLQKHELNIEKDLFLIAPTETKIIYNEKQKPILIIEKQDYLDKKHGGVTMTDEDIECFFMELEKQGYIVTDPNCLEKEFSNFGFLKDYHDANTTGFKSAEDLPEWFKERPIVLYDIDLVYKKNAEYVKRF